MCSIFRRVGLKSLFVGNHGSVPFNIFRVAPPRGEAYFEENAPNQTWLEEACLEEDGLEEACVEETCLVEDYLQEVCLEKGLPRGEWSHGGLAPGSRRLASRRMASRRDALRRLLQGTSIPVFFAGPTERIPPFRDRFSSCCYRRVSKEFARSDQPRVSQRLS